MADQLQAFIEFVAKDHERVLETANKIEQSLQKLDGTAKIKFEASGVEKVKGATDSLREKFIELGRSGDIARSLSASVEEGLKMGAENAGDILGAGVGAALGGAFGGIIGAQLGNLIGALPGLIGDKLQMYRDAQAQAQHSLTPDEADARMEILRQGRAGWSQYQVGKDKKNAADVFEDILGRMQMEGAAPATPEEAKRRAEEAFRRANTIVALAAGGMIGDPEQLAESIGQLEATHSHRAKMALGRNEFIASALEEKYKGYTPEQIQTAISLRDNQPGAITSSELLSILSEKAQDPRVKNFLAAKGEENRFAHFTETSYAVPWATPNQLTSDERYYLSARHAGKDVDTAKASFWTGKPYLSDEQLQRMEQILAAEKDIFKLPGLLGGESGAAHALGTGEQYGFTSLAGLAEKMQQEASGQAADAQERSATALEKIVTEGIKINSDRTPGGHGEQDHQRNRAQ